MKYIIIFAIIVSVTYGYIHIDVIENGGYTGNFCIEQDEINDTQIKCGPKLGKCSGKGKMEFDNVNVPMVEHYYSGHMRLCNIPCNFVEDRYQIHGSYPLWHFMIYKTLKLKNVTYSINDNTYFFAHIENINLIHIDNIEIIFDNNLFTYSKLKIKNDVLYFKINVESKALPNFVSKVGFMYGLSTCRKYFSLNYVIVKKPNVKCTCY